MGFLTASDSWVLTEFFTPPAPQNKQPLMGQDQNAGNPPATAQSDFNDDFLDFGIMKIVPGRAFSIGDQAGPNEIARIRASTPVRKSWQKLDGRDFLIEAVEYSALKTQLDALPDVAAIIPPDNGGLAARRKVRDSLRQLAASDRKSTRLNSSHRTISYAVFC